MKSSAPGKVSAVVPLRMLLDIFSEEMELQGAEPVDRLAILKPINHGLIAGVTVFLDHKLPWEILA